MVVLFLPALQPRYVGKVLRSAYGFFVLDQVPTPDDGDIQALDFHLFAIPPGIVEIDSVDGCENVYPPRRNAYLKDRVGALEPLFAYSG